MKINLNDHESSDLINFANLKLGLFNSKSFLNLKELIEFKDISLGFPLLLNKNNKFFLLRASSNKFKVDKNFFRKYIYKVDNKNYGPLINFFKKGDFFLNDVELKKKYNLEYKKIYNHNKKLISFIKKLKKNKKKVTAFQTRNIPHLGHEKIINFLLKKTDYLIINPVIGPKKKSDIKYEYLEKFYKSIIKKKYNPRKVFYYPVIANMYYSGPREAVHHSILRKNLGFDQFLVGRDHAGAENAYHPDAAFKIVKKLSKNLGIKVLAYKGSYFCKTCNKVVEKDACKSKKLKCKYLDISGKEFRAHIKNRKYFKFADIDLQKYIFRFKNIFS